MGKIVDLKAKNPFGKDLDMGKPKTYIGLGLMAVAVVIFGGMVMFIKGQSGKAVGTIEGLQNRLMGTGS